MSEPTKTSDEPKRLHLVPEVLREKTLREWREKHPPEDTPPDDDDEPAKLGDETE